MGAVETTSLGLATIVVGWTFIALALLAIILQLWARYIHGRSLEYYDYLLHVSFAFSFALMILTTWAVTTQGQGRHMSSESDSQFQNAAKSLFINEITWGIVNTFMRLGTIEFIDRIFRDPHSFSWVMLLCTASSIAYGVAVIITPLAICTPIRASWDSTIPGRCGNQKAASLGLEIGGLIIDLVITVWPLPVIYHLRISPAKKLGLIFIFSLGSLVFIIAGLRIAALNKINSHDFTYDGGYIGLLSIVGPLIAIICCSASVVPGLMHRARDSFRKGFPTRRTLYLIRATRESREAKTMPNSTLPHTPARELIDLDSVEYLPRNSALASVEQQRYVRPS